MEASHPHNRIIEEIPFLGHIWIPRDKAFPQVWFGLLVYFGPPCRLPPKHVGCIVQHFHNNQIKLISGAVVFALFYSNFSTFKNITQPMINQQQIIISTAKKHLFIFRVFKKTTEKNKKSRRTRRCCWVMPRKLLILWPPW